MKGLGSVRLCTALLVSLIAPLTAQVNSGEISGSVVDSSGAAIPSAAVTVISAETGLERRYETGSTGNFLFTGLLRGRYSLRVEKAGFRTTVREGLLLQVGQRARVDVSLELGSVAESLTVSTQTQLLEV